MNAHDVVGIGNIYASEACFRAGVRPGRGIWRTTRDECHRLVAAVREVLAEAIEQGGTTLRDYVGVDEDAGYLQQSLAVYEDLVFWDDTGVPEDERQTSPHTQGTSAVQFILTSSIVIHTLDQLSAVYVNIFSCKEFDPKLAERFTVEWFGAGDCSARFIERI